MSNYDSGGDLAKYAIWAVTAAIIAYSTGAGIAVLIGVATGLIFLVAVFRPPTTLPKPTEKSRRHRKKRCC